MKTLESKFCTDKYMKVLGSLTKSPKSVQQISFETNVPLTSVYRSLKFFEEKKLVQMSGYFGIIKGGSMRRIRVYKKSDSKENCELNDCSSF
jgi:predicted transcriptional regulator